MKKESFGSTPILVANTEWPLPENLINYVKSERMVNGLVDMVSSLSPEEQVGYAEVVAYMMPETQKRPLTGIWVNIYLYCTKKLMERQKIVVPKEISVAKLSDYELEKLGELKRWIFKNRGGKEKNPVLFALDAVFGNAKVGAQNKKGVI